MVAGASTREFEQDFRALLRLLEALEGFVLVYVFAESTRARNEFRARLVESLKLRAIAFDVVADPDSELLLAKLWQFIEPTSAGKVPLWVECDIPGEDWDRARRFLLGRLNETRYRLENSFARPLFLVLPAGWKLDAARAAPDLWSVRKWVLDVPNASVEATPIAERTSENVRSIPADTPLALERMQREWKRLAKQPPEEVVSLGPGWSLVDALLEWNSPQAMDVAGQVRHLAQQRVDAGGSDPSALRPLFRDLSLAIN